MSGQQHATRCVPVTPSAAISIHDAITFAHAVAGAGTSSAGEHILGFAYENIGAGETGNCTTGESAIARAGAEIDGSEQRLKTAAGGALIPWTTSGDIVAALLRPGQTAAAAGDLIEVYPLQGAAS